jgi:hypothetical protein
MIMVTITIMIPDGEPAALVSHRRVHESQAQ